MNLANANAAYRGVLLLAACVLCAGILAARLTGGQLGLPVGAVAAALTFHALRRVTGRVVAAAVDALYDVDRDAGTVVFLRSVAGMRPRA